MQFLDEAKIYVKSGSGGNGCMSFRREKYVEYGGPNGGNGGRGGDVIVEAAHGLNTLIDFRYRQHFKAKNGQTGMGRNRNGKYADPIILKVPVGTQILAEDRVTVIADMLEEGQSFVLAKGGDGGFGNAHFKSSTNQAPTRATDGYPGEGKWLWLCLKLISDAGLVGLPNAGKSTFLSQVSAAKPKIADYPFTTLKPQLGVVSVDTTEFVVADIPGLIEGAHEGVGLGDTFLRHVERCGVLIHLVDGTTEDVTEHYRVIRHELEEYSTELAQKEEIVVLNKCDALQDDERDEKKQALEEVSGASVMCISAVTRDNLTPLLRIVQEKVQLFHAKEDNTGVETLPEDDIFSNW